MKRRKRRAGKGGVSKNNEAISGGAPSMAECGLAARLMGVQKQNGACYRSIKWLREVAGGGEIEINSAASSEIGEAMAGIMRRRPNGAAGSASTC